MNDGALEAPFFWVVSAAARFIVQAVDGGAGADPLPDSRIPRIN